MTPRSKGFASGADAGPFPGSVPAAAGVRRWAALLGVVGCAAVAALGPIPTAAADQRTAQLSIAIDNGRESVAVGDELTYTISVTNTGDAGVTGLIITQSMPAGLAFGSADSNGIAAADAVTWTIDLAADQTSTLGSAMTVTPTDDRVLRLASVACAAESPGGPPVVCAAHSDLLPAGALTVAAGMPPVDVVDPLSDSRAALIGGSAAVVAAAGITVLLTIRRRAHHRRTAVG